MGKTEREASHSITEWGAHVFDTQDATVCSRCGHTIVPSRGRPDLFCALGKLAFCVEVKSASRSFPFSKFTEDQRKWAIRYVLDKGGLYYLWLTMGTRVNAKKWPRKVWLIPLRDFLAAEAIVQQFQKSLPYEAHRTEMQLREIDAVSLFKNFGLEWQGGGIFGLPAIHPLKDEIERVS